MDRTLSQTSSIFTPTSPIMAPSLAGTISSTTPSLSMSLRDMLVDVRANGPAAQSQSRLSSLIAATRALGESTFWGNDVLEGVSKKGGWRLNLLAQDADLCGFCVYRFDSEQAKVEVAYLAVSPQVRGQGCGRVLIRWIQQWAQTAVTRSKAEVLVCACVAESVGFYQKLGFRRTRPIEAQTEEEKLRLVQGQMLMIWKIPPLTRKIGRKYLSFVTI